MIIAVVVMFSGCVEAQDSDGDGWTDQQEINAGTDPYNKDTDGDGYWDPNDGNPLDPDIPGKQIISTPGGFKELEKIPIEFDPPELRLITFSDWPDDTTWNYPPQPYPVLVDHSILWGPEMRPVQRIYEKPALVQFGNASLELEGPGAVCSGEAWAKVHHERAYGSEQPVYLGGHLQWTVKLCPQFLDNFSNAKQPVPIGNIKFYFTLKVGDQVSIQEINLPITWERSNITFREATRIQRFNYMFK